MNTVRITSLNSIGTRDLGRRIGKKLKGGEIIELSGDLGAGKTTFTNGLVQGSGTGGGASSPTFTVSKVYSGDKLSIHHYDFYRLSDIGLMKDEIEEVMSDEFSVVVIEWAGDIKKSLPTDRLVYISISAHPTEEDSRVFEITLPAPLSYLENAVRLDR